MAKWPSNKIVTNGITLNYYRSGGDKPPLILCHGITDNGLCWLRVGQVLENDYDLIMIDARGHGLSDKPDTGYARTDHANDVAGLIEALGLEKPYVMGHSMGGGTAATLAANYPDLVGCAILEDPPWRDQDDMSNPERQAGFKAWQDSIVKAKEQSRAEITATGRERSPTWAEIEFDPWSLAKQQASPNVFQIATESQTTWRDLIPSLTCPTLLVTGDPEAGAIVTPAMAKAVSDLNSNIQVAHISGAGHNIRREQFERFVTVVKEFLSQQ